MEENRQFLNKDTEDSVIPFGAKRWADYLLAYTPVEQKSDGVWYKREDKFALFGVNTLNGSKCRQLLYLFESRPKGVDTVIHGTNVNASPQTPMTAAMAQHYGLRCIQVAGGTNFNSISGKDLPRFATMFGAEYDLSCRSGFNVGVQKRVKTVMKGFENCFTIERDITLDHKLAMNKASNIQSFHEVGAWQVGNVPAHIEDLVVPFGSANSATSIMLGLSMYKPKNVQRIHLINVGVDKRDYMFERLKLMGADVSAYDFLWHDTKVPYSKLFKGVRLDDMTFHPRYEAKTINYMRNNLPELIKDTTLFWNIGSYPDINTTANNLNLSIPKRVKEYSVSPKSRVGSFCKINNIKPVKELKYGMDFREPQYRREVFLRLYEFHLKHRSHPGGVYFAFHWLTKEYDLDADQKLWLAFINGCSQNIVTSWHIFNEFPQPKGLNVDLLDKWWNKVQHKFKAGSGWDSDRRYFKVGKTGLPNCVRSYLKQVNKYGSQEEMFNSLCEQNDPYLNFGIVWDFVKGNFLSFGRLSTFSYLEYLRIQGVNIDCNNLFLEDISGSRSHRNGLCKVLGRDDLDWWKTKITYPTETINWLTEEAATLLEEAKERYPHEDAGYFTLESAFCNFKSWHRPNRRYPNVYMDMFYNRIKYAEQEWGTEEGEIFWKMRKECLPKALRLEDNPKDLGLCSEKQNHYLYTGQPVMMDGDWECFNNDYNRLVNS